MMSETHSKNQSRHLKRGAYLYVRRQVFENTESTNANTICVTAPSPSDGGSIRLSSLILTSVSRAHPPSIARGSSAWSPR
jgi:hypothetical protein